MGNDIEINKPNFWAVIPATVRYDKQLSSTAKLLFAELTALSNKEGYCWASNQYFGDLFGLASGSVSRLIAELEERGFVRTVVDKSKGNERQIYPQVTAQGVVGEKKKKSLVEKFDEMIGEVAPELREERQSFLDYWTAKNDGGKKEHWEKQTTFAIRQRWATWVKNKRKWEKPKFEKLPTDEELRASAKKEADRKGREEEEKRRMAEMSRPRTPEEQARVDARLAEMRKNLGRKFAV